MSKSKIQFCQWKHDDVDGGWDTGCGEKFEFTNDGPKENGVRFCYHCGKPVTLVGDQQPEPVEPEELKALASATGLAGAIENYEDENSRRMELGTHANLRERPGCQRPATTNTANGQVHKASPM